MAHFVEVSHPIEAGMITYPGLPTPVAEVLVDHESSRDRYAGQAEFLIASLQLCGNTGTYVDSPFHRFRDAPDLAAMPLHRMAHVRTIVIQAVECGRAIGPDIFRGKDLRRRAVLVRTDWSRYWRTEQYFKDHPFLTADACDYLVEAEARFVGIDSLNIDDTDNPARPAHTRLLGSGIPVCEHMTNLAAVPEDDAYLHAVPVAWKGGASFPVRAYVMI